MQNEEWVKGNGRRHDGGAIWHAVMKVRDLLADCNDGYCCQLHMIQRICSFISNEF